MRRVFLSLLLLPLTFTLGCRQVALRDPQVYQNEVYFLQMALEQNTELLAAHLQDGDCFCDDRGRWNNEVCEASAVNVVVLASRLQWHVDMMMYLAKLQEDRPGEEPEIPSPSELCPESSR